MKSKIKWVAISAAILSMAIFPISTAMAGAGGAHGGGSGGSGGGTGGGSSSAGYLKPGTFGLHDLFLAYAGDKVSASSTGSLSVEPQDWYSADFTPLLTYINRTSGQAVGPMFQDYLFLAQSIQDPTTGEYKYIGRVTSFPTGTAAATTSDWQTYSNILLSSNENIGALYQDALASGNGLNQAIPANVWVALPYPFTSMFSSDHARAVAVENWIDSFIQQWNSSIYGQAGSPLTLRGFYWEDEADTVTSTNNDGTVMQAINNYVHKNYPSKTVWIPYRGASGWNSWRSWGFDAAFYQPDYYFNANDDIPTAAYDAYQYNMGIQMEFDLGVTWNSTDRLRFIAYLNDGATGGVDSNGDTYQPYMGQSALSWYTGGWYWSNGVRSQAMEKIYSDGDSLYDSIYQFISGSYQPGTAK